ncbi:SAM-dependent methyltransferase [Kitasatospora viridis]|uniref:Cyclopropane-fatty-acyl-phospholipid synthase n=1 Tax=Kitasatospora viridis TaxID=281105 RepID=A0A561UBZ4_9ACTN|nr:cyclopropane-fatty-acyl-phospholipid synthase family protein [Kitasatospora viridis]TWF96883.1 cyclopropane-fatty-acyl-phospholipid synthase [Kitasatospora viridis]
MSADSKADVAVAYDVDNEFFRLWLDEGMSYSCGVWDHTDDLDEAQAAKLAVIHEFAGITPSSRVLDIGCGWGGNLESMVRDRGVAQAHGITLSEAQYAEVLRRELPGVTADCVDYRDYQPDSPFDAVTSICMIEHVCSVDDVRSGRAGAKYQDYFRRAHEWTRPGARFGLQTILRDRIPRSSEAIQELAWASNHIFPGGLAPRIEEIVVASAPYWELIQLRTRRLDYQRTCAEWRTRLRRHEALIRERWSDQLFEDYDRYLTACVNGFGRREISLAQWSLRRID